MDKQFNKDIKILKKHLKITYNLTKLILIDILFIILTIWAILSLDFSNGIGNALRSNLGLLWGYAFLTIPVLLYNNAFLRLQFLHPKEIYAILLSIKEASNYIDITTKSLYVLEFRNKNNKLFYYLCDEKPRLLKEKTAYHITAKANHVLSVHI